MNTENFETNFGIPKIKQINVFRKISASHYYFCGACSYVYRGMILIISKNTLLCTEVYEIIHFDTFVLKSYVT